MACGPPGCIADLISHGIGGEPQRFCEDRFRRNGPAGVHQHLPELRLAQAPVQFCVKPFKVGEDFGVPSQFQQRPHFLVH